jgi:gas vesicle protein
MKPAWDQLMGEYKDHATALVADVDCTAEGKPLCDSNGIQGFPTIKHGSWGALEDYQGGRSFDDLKKFADENLKPSCGPSNLDLCDDDKKKEIEELMALSDDEIEKKISEGEDKLKEADTTFEGEVKKLQEKYESLMKEKDEAIAAVKSSGLGLLKSVSAAKAKAAKDEL